MTVLEYIAASAGDGQGPDAEAWAASLDAAVARSPAVREVLRYGGPDASSGGPVLRSPLEEASLRGFNVLVEVRVAADAAADTAAASYAVRDTLRGDALAEGSWEGPAPFLYELSETYWLTLVSALETVKPTEEQSYVRIAALPGSRLYGFGLTGAVVDETGELRVEARLPGTYPWRVTRRGMAVRKGVFAALENDALLSVEQRPLRRWSVEAGLDMGQFPDLWFSRYFLDNSFFLKMGLRQYLFGFFFPEPYRGDDGMGTDWTVGLPMLMPGLGIGYQFGDSASFLRPYLSGAIHLRVNTDLGMVDPIGPLSMHASFGLDWRLADRLSLFGEAGGVLYPLSIGDLMVASKGDDGGSGPVGFIYDDDWYAEFPNFRIGVRFYQ